MKRIEHCIVILPTWLKAQAKKILNCLKNSILVILSANRCYRILCKKNQIFTNNDPKLAYYYPDNGREANIYGITDEVVSADLSIIIPAYNVSGYITDCLNSILSQQTKYSFDIIVVDDGSVDGTWEKIQKHYTDERIRLFRQKNSGQSVARNFAISNSCGKYIMMLDGDDILLPGAIDKLMNAALENDADIAEGNCVRFYDKITDEMICDSKTKFHISSNSVDPKFVLTCVGYSVAKVYRRDLWQNVRYPEGYIFEDVISKFVLRRIANKVVFIGDAVYGYRWNNMSSSHSSDSLKKLDSIWVLPRIIEICRLSGAPMDDTFYLLCLNHIGLLNRITTKDKSDDIQLACFSEMRKQLESVIQYRPKRLPYWFMLLEKAIMSNHFDAWAEIADTIQKYGLLKKWREIN